MKNRKQLTYLIIFLAVFLVAIVGATYAYFESATDLEGAEFNVQTITAGATTFTGYSTGTIEVEANSTSMTQANVSTNVVDHDNATVTVKVDSENENSVTTCTYDLVWVWDSDDIYTEADVKLPYAQQVGNTYETCKYDPITQTTICEGDPQIFFTLYQYELSVKIDGGEEKDLSSFTWNGKEAVIANKSVTSSDGELTYSIDVQIYNIPVVQTKLFNKQFQAHIEIRNNVCTSVEGETEPEIVETLASLCEGQNAASCIRDNYTLDSSIYHHTAELANSAEDGSYRYAGANPDNYVCFEGDDCTNEENLYRIIGVFNNQLKLIKHTHIGGMTWDSSNNNIWQGSSLEKYLNGAYLTTLGAKASLIATTTWSVGGHSNFLVTAKEMYGSEMNMSTTYTGKIGLMYLSEYGYATINTNWTAILSDYDKSAKDTNWLLDSEHDQWTISRYSVVNNLVSYVYSTGSVTGYTPTDDYNVVRPSFTLISTIKIKDGTGNQRNPYIIGL